MGDLDPPVLQDNLRSIAQREAKLIDRRRKLQQSAVKLSLFLRTPDGIPIIPSESALGSFPEPERVPQSQLEADVAVALRQRPRTGGAGGAESSGQRRSRRGPQSLSPFGRCTAHRLTGRGRANQQQARQIKVRTQKQPSSWKCRCSAEKHAARRNRHSTAGGRKAGGPFANSAVSPPARWTRRWRAADSDGWAGRWPGRPAWRCWPRRRRRPRPSRRDARTFRRSSKCGASWTCWATLFLVAGRHRPKRCRRPRPRRSRWRRPNR